VAPHHDRAQKTSCEPKYLHMKQGYFAHRRLVARLKPQSFEGSKHAVW
jgi:hypothetical protein